jgi:PAS domain S-box-containing protein
LLLRAWRRGFSSDQALGESEERFRLLFKYSPIGLVLVSPDRRIFDANEAFCAMVGRGLEELKRCTFLDITHPDDRDENLVNVNGLLESRLLHYSAEKRYLHKAGHVVLAHVLATAIRNQAGKVLYGLAIVEDITEHREAERIRIERMEKQRDVLVREVHHRIKNNLQGVVNLLEQIKLKQPNAADALEEAAGQISAVAVVHGLKSRAQALEIRPRELVQAIVAAIVRISSVPIICSQNDDPLSREWRLNGRDAVAIALVVNELIYNAIKHTRPDKEAEVTINFESQPGAFSILVRNRPATLPANFDWESGAGFGTGLSLIAALLPPHGARLAFSQRNGGVEALLQLSHPCVDVPAALSH